jgi:uncharacterized protein YkwD
VRLTVPRRGIAVAAVTTVVLATASDASACPFETATVEQAAPGELERGIQCRIDEVRINRGLTRLRPHSVLSTVADTHANDMVAGEFFSHVSPDSGSFSTRIRRARYGGRGAWSAGEVLAWGTGRLSTPRAIVAAWLDSPPHRRLLLAARFREAGVAAVPGIDAGTRRPKLTVAVELGRRG